jgi:hypothetical protein
VVSSTIITTKPIIRPKVPSILKPRRWVSGMISLLITNSMAPAANARVQGSSGSIRVTAATPISPPTGSTMPVRSATVKAWPRE